MDTPTQIVLGAAVGQALYSHRLGRRAVGWGALAGLLPDLDMVVSASLGPWGEYYCHRGPTHSLFFGLVVGPLLGYGVWRWTRRKSGPEDPSPLNAWIGLFLAAILTHPLLDIFTAYGTQLLWPLTHHRFALNGIGIIDPAYTGLLLAALITGWRKRRALRAGRRAAIAALALTTTYLLLGYGMNLRAEAVVRRHLEAEGVRDARIRCYPTLLQLVLRRVVVRRHGEIRIGTYTFLDPDTIAWRRFTPETHPLADTVLETPLGQAFRWFSMGQVTARVSRDPKGFLVEIDDLRYGYPIGPPDRGLWGIKARFDSSGTRVGEVQRFRRPPPVDIGTLVKALWQDVVGRSGIRVPVGREGAGYSSKRTPLHRYRSTTTGHRKP